jgi:hypothetical protein
MRALPDIRSARKNALKRELNSVIDKALEGETLISRVQA